MIFNAISYKGNVIEGIEHIWPSTYWGSQNAKDWSKYGATKTHHHCWRESKQYLWVYQNENAWTKSDTFIQ